MTTTTGPVPLRVIEPDGYRHPGWCSPHYCRADLVGRSHESEPIKVGNLKMTAAKSVVDSTDAIVLIDANRGDVEGSIVVRFLEIPTLVRTLMDLYVKQ